MHVKRIVLLVATLVCATVITTGCGDDVQKIPVNLGTTSDAGEDDLDSGGDLDTGAEDVGGDWDSGGSDVGDELDGGSGDSGSDSDGGDGGSDADADADAGPGCGSLTDGDSRCLPDGLTVETCSMNQLSQQVCLP